MTGLPTSARRRSHRLRRTGVAAVTVCGALALSACGPPPTTTGTGAGRTEEATKVKASDCPLDSLKEAKGTTNIEMWYGGLVDPPVTVLTDMVKDFNKSQSKIKLKADNQGNDYNETLRKYEGAAATPKQLPQIIYLEDTMLGEMVDKGQVLPAAACMKADGYDPEQISAAARAAYSVDGVLYPGYMNVSTPILYYNKVHFQKAGLDPNKPPKTLAEIEQAAKAIKKWNPKVKPFSFKADQWFFSTWMAGAGEDVVNNDNGRAKAATKATFDTPKSREILDDLDRMNREGLLNPFPVTEGNINHYLALVNEQSSMLVETSTASSTIAAALGGKLDPSAAGVDVDASVLDSNNLVPGSGEYPGLEEPGQIYASGGAFYILNTGSKAQQAASWEFLKYMLKPENAKKWYLQGGYLPVVKSIVHDPDVEAFGTSTMQGQLLTPAVQQLAEADPDRTGPLIGPYGKFEDILQGALEGVLFNKQDPSKALAKAQTEATAMLQDYNG